MSLAASGEPAGAFVVVALETPGEYLKWGPSQVAGTPGGVVTWGFLAAGTPGSSACGHYCLHRSVDALPNFYAAPERHNRAVPATLLSLQPAFQAAFDAWSAVADVQFRYVGIDDSLRPINDKGAESPMIRIGAFEFGGIWSHCVAGASFAPPPNVGTAAGDIFLNPNVGFQWSRAPEGSELAPFPEGNGLHMTDVYLLALHEVGHAIGLGDSPDTESAMCSADPSSATLQRVFMRRRPGADDVAGARFLYGPPRVR